MSLKRLDQLLFAQGGACFFCDLPLPKSEASVEHLVPIARAGSNSDDNCVACCKAINALLGSMSLKEKIRVVLNQNGSFTCPSVCPSARVAALTAPAVQNLNAAPAVPKIDFYRIVLEDLQKRGTSRPRKLESLKNTIRSAVVTKKKTPLTQAQLEALVKRLLANGKITVEGTTVSYSL